MVRIQTVMRIVTDEGLGFGDQGRRVTEVTEGFLSPFPQLVAERHRRLLLLRVSMGGSHVPDVQGEALSDLLYFVARQAKGPTIRPKETILQVYVLEEAQVKQVPSTKPQGAFSETLLVPSGGLQDRVHVNGGASPCLWAQRLKAGLRFLS
jgi:hypothetical protein